MDQRFERFKYFCIYDTDSKDYTAVENAAHFASCGAGVIDLLAGLRTDQDLLIRYYGITLDEVKKIYLAAAFSSFMNLDNAMDIGLLPKIHKGKYIR